MRKAAGLLLWALIGPVMAQESYLPVSSITVGGLGEYPDDARDSDPGYGAHVSVALPMSGRSGEGIEFDLYGLRREGDGDSTDSQIGLFINYGKTFGRFGWSGDTGLDPYLPSFSPYLLFGVGAMRDDVHNHSHIVPALDAGLGLGFPIGQRGVALRTEVRLIGQFNDDSVPDQDVLLDLQFRVGLQIPLGRPADDFDDSRSLGPIDDCGLKVVDPKTGRQDCTVDSDHDKVVDIDDLCAGTPPGTPVDGTGCPVSASFDMDSDGVPDDVDNCPGSPAGSSVDISGCPVSPATAPVTDIASLATAPTLVVRDLRFERESAELSASVKARLDEAALKLSAQAELIVEVAGHTDTSGKSDYNLALSLLRANNVRQYLVGRGISRYRLVVEGYGDARPLAPNNTEAGRSQNRRVEIESIDIDVIER